MVFLLRLLKSARVKSKYDTYLEIKNMTIEDQRRQQGIYSRLKFLWFRKCPIFLGGKRSKDVQKTTKCERFQIRLISAGTYENFILKSIIGFLSGVLLTYMFFMFFVFQLNFSLVSATYVGSVLGSVLSLGLAFSSKVRCVVLMLLPQLFSKRGRQALVAYAFILVFTGPAKNTMRNMRILSESMACTQAKLKEALKSLVEMLKRPFNSIKETVKQLAEQVKQVVAKIKDMINALKKTVQSLIGVIKNAFNWLNSIVGMCSKKVGTPFQRCINAFDGAIEDCKVQLGSIMDWMCSVAYVASHLCYAVKIFDYVCDLIDFVSDDLVVEAKKKLQEFMYQIRNVFYVHIEFSHSFSFETEESKSLKDVTSGMMTEISQRMSAVYSFFDIMSLGFSFFFLWMVFQILNYRRKFMTNEAFDNRYITDKIIELDVKRTQLGRETILPLNVHERKKYAQITSIRLVESERKTIAKSVIFLTLSSLKLAFHILTDFCLFWLLSKIRLHGQYQSYIDTPSSITAQVDGKGMLSELYASVLNSFRPNNIKFDLDTGSCLPDPLPPDFKRYKQVATLLIIAWIICFMEPYGLRLRFVVMSYYHPERAQIRAVWLYNNIIRKRGSFLKYARRQLRRKFAKGEDGVEEVSFIDRLRASFPILRKIWRGKKLEACLLCGGLGNKASPLVKCPRPNCVGLYCLDCYSTLQNLCTICRLPIEYGDISDISEERDSSEESVTRRAESVKTETTEELSLKEVLLPDGSGSEISYGYQYEERDVDEIMEVPTPLKDVEAQKPIDKATTDDLSPKPTIESRRYSMTLAERTSSGIWSLIPDSNTSEVRRRTHSGHEREIQSSGNVSTFGGMVPPALLSKVQEDVKRSELSNALRASKFSQYISPYNISDKEHRFVNAKGDTESIRRTQNELEEENLMSEMMEGEEVVEDISEGEETTENIHKNEGDLSEDIYKNDMTRDTYDEELTEVKYDDEYENSTLGGMYEENTEGELVQEEMTEQENEGLVAENEYEEDTTENTYEEVSIDKLEGMVEETGTEETENVYSKKRSVTFSEQRASRPSVMIHNRSGISQHSRNLERGSRSFKGPEVQNLLKDSAGKTRESNISGLLPLSEQRKVIQSEGSASEKAVYSKSIKCSEDTPLTKSDQLFRSHKKTTSVVDVLSQRLQIKQVAGTSDNRKQNILRGNILTGDDRKYSSTVRTKGIPEYSQRHSNICADSTKIRGFRNISHVERSDLAHENRVKTTSDTCFQNISKSKSSIVMPVQHKSVSKVQNVVRDSFSGITRIETSDISSFLSYQNTKSSMKMSLRDDRPMQINVVKTEKSKTSFSRKPYQTTRRESTCPSKLVSNHQNVYNSGRTSMIDSKLVAKTILKTKNTYLPIGDKEPHVDYLQGNKINQGVSGTVKVQKPPEMFDRWVRSGVFHTRTCDKKEHYSSFFNKVLQNINLTRLFSKRSKCSETLLQPSKERKHYAILSKMNTSRKNTKTNPGKANIGKGQNLWKRVSFKSDYKDSGDLSTSSST